jgi:transposase
MTYPLHEVVASTRRSWSREEKLAILAEADSTPTSVSAVARRHGLHPSLLFRWRRDACEAAVIEKGPAFTPLALPGPACPPAQERAAAGLIEIELAGGHRVRAGAGVDGAVLRGVIEALVQR